MEELKFLHYFGKIIIGGIACSLINDTAPAIIKNIPNQNAQSSSTINPIRRRIIPKIIKNPISILLNLDLLQGIALNFFVSVVYGKNLSRIVSIKIRIVIIASILKKYTFIF